MSSKISKQEMEAINNAWLNVDVPSEFIVNPLSILKTDDPDEFRKKLTWLLMQPEYFYFLCKHVFNVELLPMQCLILKEMWERKFPMLIASRGAGKAIKPKEKIRVENGWKAIEDINVGDKVYSSEGTLCNVTYKTELQKNLNMYTVHLEDGRLIDCCEDHLWIVHNDKRPNVLATKDIVQRINKGETLSIPVNEPIQETNKKYEIPPYVAGLLSARKHYETTTFRAIDKTPIIEHLKKTTNEDFPFINYYHTSIKFNDHSRFDDGVPEEYKYGSVQQKYSLLAGLLDASGETTEDGIRFVSSSKKVSDDFDDVARSLGLCVTKVGNEDGLFSSLVGFNNKVKISKIEKAEKSDGYCIKVDSYDHTYITKDYIVTHNTFLLSLYCLIRAFLMPKRKIVVVGAAFRQSKFLHDYMETIWKNAPVFRDLCDDASGPRRDVDMCKMNINGSTVVALPVGDGCCRGNTLISNERGICYIVNNVSKVWGNGKLRHVEYPIDNGVKPTKIVTTRCGFSYEGTHNHAMKVLRNNKIDWVRTDEMQIGDRILIDRTDRWHNGDFECSEDQAYMLGAMIGDGCWTNQYHLGFATKDKEIIDRINSSLNDIKFKQRSDGIHWAAACQYHKADWLNFWGLKDKCYAKDKILPESILSAPKNKMTACLQGLFDTDGHVLVSESKGGIAISVNFTNTSKELVRQIQYILLHYGIVSTVRHRDRNKKWNRVYELGIYGPNVKIFADKIGFYLPRKQEKLLEAISQRAKWNSFNDDIPLSAELVEASINRGISIPNKYCKSKILSKKSFQQSFLKGILPYCDSPDWASLVNENIFYDVIASIEDSECHTYDIHVPDGNEYCANGFFSHNSKIRGQRANDIIADEFASMSREIFENVIAGFAAVSASPAENVKRMASIDKAKKLNLELPNEIKASEDKSNQIILSGTAFYDFNHFSEYWKKWKKIIETKGDPHAIRQNIFNGEEPPESFKWDDYSVIRVPFDMIPRGFMDEGQIARSKATIHNGIFLMEFGAVFAKDSQGFFKRSLIESCVGTDIKPISLMSGEVYFDPMLRGNPNKKYIMGVDPASEVDNFSIVIVEANEDHRRIVYCWTTTRKEHTERVQKGLTTENNFYSYCARKIRELMDLFPICHIAMDAQGGGIAVSEALHDSNQLKHGEAPIWPIIEEGKEKPTDDQAGLHILELCQFAKYDWYSEANHGLRKDFEDKLLIFPRFDPITIGLSIEEDKQKNRLYDTLEDCVMEIEELKNELSLIEITRTDSGRERWDTPEVKIGVGKKERMRKDRYSALLMANMAARTIHLALKQAPYNYYGGFASIQSGPDDKKVSYIGPDWFTSSVQDLYTSY